MNIISEFKIKVRCQVSWGEMDVFQHVNNVNYFRYYENSRVKYFDEIGLMKAYQENGIFGAVKSISCEYLVPLTYPDEIEVGARVTAIHEEGFTMEHYINSKTKGLSAFGEAEIILFNNKSNKTEKLPEAIKQKIEIIEQTKF